MKKIETLEAPKALGPYSQAISSNGFVFCSGQIGINPIMNELVKGGIKEETKQVLKNIKGVLAAAGLNISRVVKTEVYLKSMFEFDDMNEIYADVFTSLPHPARVTVEVSKLPKNALIEIACIATKE